MRELVTVPGLSAERPNNRDADGERACLRPGSPCDQDDDVYATSNRKGGHDGHGNGAGSRAARACKTIVASSKRTSRAAGAALPSLGVLEQIPGRIESAARALLAEGGRERYVRLTPPRGLGKRGGRGSKSSSFRAPGPQTTDAASKKALDRINSLRRNSTPTRHPSWVSTTSVQYLVDMVEIVKVGVKRNAVSSALTVRGPSQAAALQFSRFNFSSIERALIGQQVLCAISLAMANWGLRRKLGPGVLVASPYGAIEMSACASVCGGLDGTRLGGIVIAPSALSGACMPSRLRPGGLLDEAQRLAEAELDETRRLISTTFGRQSAALDRLCSSVLERGPFDPFWAAVVLLNYAVSHPRGRALVEIDDVGCKLAEALEIYGRSEDTRRRNHAPKRAELIECKRERELELNKKKKKKKKKLSLSPSPSPSPSQSSPRPREHEQVRSGDDPADDPSRWADDDLLRLGAPVDWDGARVRGDGDLDEGLDDLGDEMDGDWDEEWDEDEGEDVGGSSKRAKGESGDVVIRGAAQGLDPETTLAYWDRALGGEHSNVLHTLVASGQDLVEISSLETLEQQAPGVSYIGDSLISRIVVWYANEVNRGMRGVLDPEAQNVPVPVCFRVDPTNEFRNTLLGVPDGSTEAGGSIAPPLIAVGFRRREAESLCTLAHATVSGAIPPPDGEAILWSLASWLVHGRSEKVPGTVERLALRGECAARGPGPPRDSAALPTVPTVPTLPTYEGPRRLVDHGDTQRLALLDRLEIETTSRPMVPEVSGITRSFLVFREKIQVYRSDHEAADVLVEEGLAAWHQGVGAPPASSAHSAGAELLYEGRVDESSRRVDPLLQPVPSMVLGMRIGRMIEPWLASNMRKNAPCRHLLAPWNKRTESTSSDYISDYNPPPLLAITDCVVEQIGAGEASDTPVVPGALPATTTPFSFAYQVVGDRAMRMLDACERMRETETETSADETLVERLALITIGAAQAAFIGDIGLHLGADRINNAVANSRRFIAADLSTLDWIGVYQVYVAGRGNMKPSVIGTPWEGQTGSWIDPGCTPPSLEAKGYGDKRVHGTMWMSQDVADEMATELTQSKNWWIDVGGGVIAPRPVETRGVPWGLIPGVHAALRHYAAATELVRDLASPATSAAGGDLPSDSFVTDLVVFPVSPLAEQCAPDCRPGEGDVGYRWCTRRRRDGRQHSSGRTVNPDETDEDLAISNSRRLRTPGKSNAWDDPFASASDEVCSFYLWATVLAALSRQCAPPGASPAAGVRALKLALRAYLCRPKGAVATAIERLRASRDCSEATAEASVRCRCHPVAARAAVALSAMYPSTWGLDESIVHPGLASAAPACAQCVAAQRGAGHRPVGLSVWQMVGEEQLDEADAASAERWWSAFDRADPARCAWEYGVGPLLVEVAATGSSHDLSPEDRRRMCRLLDRSICAAFLVHSPDGQAPPAPPCPLSNIGAPEHVRRDHVDPIHVTRFDDEQPRAGVVGQLRFQARQILVALESGHLGVRAQAARLFGQLTKRPSSNPEIVDQFGRPRTDKANSHLNQDRNHLAYGTIEKRKESCALQREAWDSNARILQRAMTAIDPPLPKARRDRGRHDVARRLQCDVRKADSVRSEHGHETRAERAFDLALARNCAARATVELGRLARGEPSRVPLVPLAPLAHLAHLAPSSPP